jgi:hypothetical protein
MGVPGKLIKSAAEIETIARAGVILRHTLDLLTREVKEGVTLAALDRLAEKTIRANGGEPAFKGYRPEGASKPYPATICASVNDVVVHDVPTTYVLKKGDVLKIDCGVKINGWYSDAAVTVAIGTVPPKVKKMIHTSSTAAIGINTNPHQVLNEDSPFNAAHLGLAYFTSKYDAELEVKKYCEQGLNAVIVKFEKVWDLADRDHGGFSVFHKWATGMNATGY